MSNAQPERPLEDTQDFHLPAEWQREEVPPTLLSVVETDARDNEPAAELAVSGLRKVTHGVAEGAKAFGSFFGTALGVLITGEPENPFKK